MSPFDVLSAEFSAESREAKHIPAVSMPEVALAGRSNVGKSTLLNAICQRKALARVSRTPGCTRGIVMFDLRMRSGVELRLVDLPGYGFADRSKSERRGWGSLIEKYLLNRPTLRGVFILVDSRRGVEPEEAELAEFLRVAGVPFILVATKIDKMSRSERGLVLKQLSAEAGVRAIGVSGETGEGREELMRAMARLVEQPADGAAETSELHDEDAPPTDE